MSKTLRKKEKKIFFAAVAAASVVLFAAATNNIQYCTRRNQRRLFYVRSERQRNERGKRYGKKASKFAYLFISQARDRLDLNVIKFIVRMGRVESLERISGILNFNRWIYF